MIRVSLTADLVAAARELYPFDALNNSIMEGGSNVFGAVGELVFAAAYPEWEHTQTYDHDFAHPSKGTVDIKTKRTTAVPQPHWNCSVAVTSLHQRCDYLFFVRVNESLTDAWLLGWLPAGTIPQVGVFGRKGEDDGTGWRYKADCWNVRVDQLNEPGQAHRPDRCPSCHGRVAGSGHWADWCGCPFRWE